MRRVIVIDDEELVRHALGQILEAAGYDIEVAGNGVDGVAAFVARPADLVIVDTIMPNQDGVETMMDLRRLDASVKIIVMSGGGRTRNTAYLKAAQTLGADAILTKPFTPEELLAAIERCFAAQTPSTIHP